MTETGTVIAVVLLVMAAAIALSLFNATLERGSSSSESFKPKRLLTSNELEFLARLEAAVPELRFCPQVAMGALLEPSVGRSDSRRYYRQRGMFSQKIVDFVALRPEDGAVVAIIELDDRTHDSEKDAKRDAMLSSAGYKIIRWQSKNKPATSIIRASLFPEPPRSGQSIPGGIRAEKLSKYEEVDRIEPT